jgi:transcriptional regulator with XRE-family HTH domain
MTITEVIQRAISDSGMSVNQVAKATGVSQSALSHFLSSDSAQRRDIRLATADKLAEFFGLTLVAKPSAAPPPSDKKKKSAAVAKSSIASTATKSSIAGTPARRRKSGSKSSSRSSSRGTVRKLTREEMDAEFARVEWENGTGKGRLRIAKLGGDN